MTAEEVKKTLDVALLKPTATAAEIEALAGTLRREGYSFLCVNSLHTAAAVRVLEGSRVAVVTCVGFPQGAVKTETKVFETESAVAEGAGEIDMVMNLGALLAGDVKLAEADVRAVVRAAQGRPVKVIIETPFLTMRQKAEASRVAQGGGASFVKTCTGTSPDPIALYEDVRLIRQTIGPHMGIKASGRVGSWFRYRSMMEAGATRVGLVLEQAREILRGCDEERSGTA